MVHPLHTHTHTHTHTHFIKWACLSTNTCTHAVIEVPIHAYCHIISSVQITFLSPSTTMGVAPTANRELATKSIDKDGITHAMTGARPFSFSNSFQGLGVDTNGVDFDLSCLGEPSTLESKISSTLRDLQRSFRVPSASFFCFLRNIIGVSELLGLYAIIRAISKDMTFYLTTKQQFVHNLCEQFSFEQGSNEVM